MDGKMEYYSRLIESELIKSIETFPVIAVTGPRQCGKSTLVKYLAKEKLIKRHGKYQESIYLDLERPSDLGKLENAE